MEFARIGLLAALLIGMRKKSSTARKRTTLDPKEASMKNPGGPPKGELESRKNVSKNRHGTAVSMLTEHAQLRKRIAELDLWLRELERNRLDYDHKIDGAKRKAIEGAEQEDAMQDNLSKRGQPDRSKIAMNEAFEVRHWIKHLGVSEEELQRAVDKVGNSAAAVKKELEK
jgi:hypothetical protein